MRLVSWKSGNAIVVCAVAIALGHIITPSGSLRAMQGQPTLEKPSTPATQPTPTQPTPKPAMRPPVPVPITLGPNARVEITITDQAGTDTPVKKTLSVIVASGHNGSIRSGVKVALTGPEGPEPKYFRYEDLPLNVDVKADVLDNGLIRTQVILNYETYNMKERQSGMAVQSVVTCNQTVMLENGKPLIVSQSADAATDRKVTLEVKATILK